MEEMREYVKALDKRLQTQWNEFNRVIEKVDK
jgi:hypothetical protein